jgi:hypothetical protein
MGFDLVHDPNLDSSTLADINFFKSADLDISTIQ